MSFPQIDRNAVAELTTTQMIDVDRAMIEDCGIAPIQMMENAGRALAIVARDTFRGRHATGKTVVVLAGFGGTGGGAIAVARRLAAWGADVTVGLTRAPERQAGVPARQMAILMAMGVPVRVADPETGTADGVLDGVIGTSLSGAPSGLAEDLIRWANGQSAPVLALDAPSGLASTTGTAFAPASRLKRP